MLFIALFYSGLNEIVSFNWCWFCNCFTNDSHCFSFFFNSCRYIILFFPSGVFFEYVLQVHSGLKFTLQFLVLRNKKAPCFTWGYYFKFYALITFHYPHCFNSLTLCKDKVIYTCCKVFTNINCRQLIY